MATMAPRIQLGVVNFVHINLASGQILDPKTYDVVAAAVDAAPEASAPVSIAPKFFSAEPVSCPLVSLLF